MYYSCEIHKMCVKKCNLCRLLYRSNERCQRCVKPCDICHYKYDSRFYKGCPKCLKQIDTNQLDVFNVNNVLL